ncbi:sigma factor-like helix-turn-helix DNA-binding protein [Pseudalkalibacillus decolorationis]|uniref:sigma factor-like helix-turn-helix DNA-binding protein n=1 Tax=Pseudalkalibacillus decolorationis TaxID=163879 RepID=UPI0021486FD1|nr:sigma factor-like helix-turn-helix DNA-binding protein [Pseudalkalibacillus decolorationis]
MNSYHVNKKTTLLLYHTAIDLSIDHLKGINASFDLDTSRMASGCENVYTDQIASNTITNNKHNKLQNQDPFQKAMVSLSIKDRAVITLKYTRKMSLKDISQIVKIPESMVEASVFRSREAVNKVISNS